jgi:hypothetical protein
MENLNRKIALFMGGKILKTETYEMPHGSRGEIEIEYWSMPKGIDYNSFTEIGHFSFDRNWDHLMAAVDFLENQGYSFSIYRNECQVYKSYHGFQVKVSEVIEKNKMNAIFKSVCETIEHEENYTK